MARDDVVEMAVVISDIFLLALLILEYPVMEGIADVLDLAGCKQGLLTVDDTLLFPVNHHGLRDVDLRMIERRFEELEGIAVFDAINVVGLVYAAPVHCRDFPGARDVGIRDIDAGIVEGFPGKFFDIIGFNPRRTEEDVDFFSFEVLRLHFLQSGHILPGAGDVVAQGFRDLSGHGFRFLFERCPEFFGKRFEVVLDIGPAEYLGMSPAVIVFRYLLEECMDDRIRRREIGIHPMDVFSGMLEHIAAFAARLKEVDDVVVHHAAAPDFEGVGRVVEPVMKAGRGVQGFLQKDILPGQRRSVYGEEHGILVLRVDEESGRLLFCQLS